MSTALTFNHLQMSTNNNAERDDKTNNDEQLNTKSINVKVSITGTLKISGDRSKPKKHSTVRIVVNNQIKFFIVQFPLIFRYFIKVIETLFIKRHTTFEFVLLVFVFFSIFKE
jgi:hypothetical protein